MKQVPKGMFCREKSEFSGISNHDVNISQGFCYCSFIANSLYSDGCAVLYCECKMLYLINLFIRVGVDMTHEKPFLDHSTFHRPSRWCACVRLSEVKSAIRFWDSYCFPEPFVITCRANFAQISLEETAWMLHTLKYILYSLL